jgi:hypothetical protein
MTADQNNTFRTIGQQMTASNGHTHERASDPHIPMEPTSIGFPQPERLRLGLREVSEVVGPRDQEAGPITVRDKNGSVSGNVKRRQ